MEMEALNPQLQTHVALVSSPGMGHLFPDLELAQRLTTLHGFTVTVFVISSHSSPVEDRVINSEKSSKSFNLVLLPPLDISHLVDSTTAVVTQLAVMMRQNLPVLRSAISVMNPLPTILIVDLFGTEAFSIADEFQMAKFVFIASHAWLLALTIYAPILDQEVIGQYVDQKEPIFIPGCEPVRPCDVVDPMLDRTDQQYHEYVRVGKEITLSDGVLVNSWEDLQGRLFAAFRDENMLGRFMKSPVYGIGPLIRPSHGSDLKNELFDWLNSQLSESVIFISFGSGGTLSFKQLTELAHGIELSQQRFIWVIRPPTEKPDATFFNTGDGTDGKDSPASYLPPGFLTRTRNVGHVLPMWGEQIEILSHGSVGGFLTHCGWNSCLESLTNGIPMIAWPLYAEQRMNATMLVEELRVAVRPKAAPWEEVIEREEVAAMVKKIMVDEDGKAMRVKAKEIRESGEMAMAEAGSSYLELSRVAESFKAFSSN